MRIRLLTLFLLLLAFPLSAKTFKSHDGTVLYYDVIGKGAPVVFLAGGPGFSSDYLRPVAVGVKGKFARVLFDQRGTGRSKLETVDAKTMTFANLVADLEALRAELGAEQLTIVGHSWGGILAQMYAGEHPERVRALALVDSGGPTLQGFARFNANLNARFSPEDLAKIKEWSAPEKMSADHKRAVLELTKAKTAAYFHDRAKAQVLIDGLTEDSFNDKAFWALVGQLTPAFDLRAGLKNLEAPVLIVHGKSDPLETAQEVHEALAGSKLELLENAGHFPWLEQPEVFYRILGGFLAEVVQR